MVDNFGRQPATVAAIGLQWDIEPPIAESARKGEIMANMPHDRVRIEPGGHHQIWWCPKKASVHLDTPMRPYVDVGPRRIYGQEQPMAYLRWLEVMGWQPDQPIAAKRKVALLTAPYAKQTVARWKLWKPKILRTRQRAREIQLTREEGAAILAHYRDAE